MSTWIDLDLTLSKKRSGDINDFTGVDAVKSSLRNIFMTLKGERRMRPEFATNIYNLLFEPMDEITATEIGEEIIEGIERWEQRVIVEMANVVPNYDKNRYDMVISFRLRNSNQIEEISEILVRK